MIDKNDNTLKYFNNYSDTMDKNKIQQQILDSIVLERYEVYWCFIMNLSVKIHETYFGSKYIKTEEEIQGHFKWCFNEIMKAANKAGIFFRKDGNELYDYLFESFNMLVYNSNEFVDHEIDKLFFTFFNMNDVNTIIDLKSFFELYNVFENSLKRYV